MSNWLSSVILTNSGELWKPGRSLSPGIPVTAADSLRLRLLASVAVAPSSTVTSEVNTVLFRIGMPLMLVP